MDSSVRDAQDSIPQIHPLLFHGRLLRFEKQLFLHQARFPVRPGSRRLLHCTTDFYAGPAAKNRHAQNHELCGTVRIKVFVRSMALNKHLETGDIRRRRDFTGRLFRDETNAFAGCSSSGYEHRRTLCQTGCLQRPRDVHKLALLRGVTLLIILFFGFLQYCTAGRGS